MNTTLSKKEILDKLVIMHAYEIFQKPLKEIRLVL